MLRSQQEDRAHRLRGLLLDRVAAGAAVRRLLAEDPSAFDHLFHPTSRTRVPVAAEIAAGLRQAGLAEGADDQLWGLVRARRVGARAYFLEVEEGAQYHQDVWPETDALLDAIATAKPGRCLDVGTGCGILAIEAAARGHAVVATDLYDTAVELARFNAELNGVSGIDFRVGHLFVPVAGEQFDLVVTAPHYGRMFDQLRLEVLKDGPRHLSPDGRLFLATTLEWEEAGPLALEPLLRSLSARVTPIVSPRTWFTFDVSGGEVPRLISRHRFLVEVGGAQSLSMTRPPAHSQPTRRVLPLARLSDTAAVLGGEDVAALRHILEQLAQPRAHFSSLPSGLIDACRFGARTCSKAAGALVDLEGGVRPCTHGAVVAGVDHTLAELEARLSALHHDAEVRRGCPSCEARDVCSRCLFPAALDERDYCALVRAHHPSLPRLHRLLDIGRKVGGWQGPVALQRWPDSASEAAWPELASRFAELDLWLVQDGERASLWWPHRHELLDAPLGRVAAAVGDVRLLGQVGLPRRRVNALAARLAEWVGVDRRAIA